jgi:hypothetical protein
MEILAELDRPDPVQRPQQLKGLRFIRVRTFLIDDEHDPVTVRILELDVALTFIMFLHVLKLVHGWYFPFTFHGSPHGHGLHRAIVASTQHSNSHSHVPRLSQLRLIRRQDPFLTLELGPYPAQLIIPHDTVAFVHTGPECLVRWTFLELDRGPDQHNGQYPDSH